MSEKYGNSSFSFSFAANTACAPPSEFGAGLQAAVEQLQQALDRPEIRDEAMQVLRGLIEHVAIGSAGEGLEIEIVGEIAKMVELGIGPMQNRPTSMRD